jgi:hypothetical protein
MEGLDLVGHQGWRAAWLHVFSVMIAGRLQVHFDAINWKEEHIQPRQKMSQLIIVLCLLKSSERGGRPVKLATKNVVHG